MANELFRGVTKMKLSFITHVFLILFLIFLNNLNSQSKQTSSISGVVLDDDTGEPIPTVNVFLDGTTLGTSTNKYGEYKIDYIPMGSYKIIASMIGYEKKDVVISLDAKKTTEINF
jgi:CarboxypepD_reg-like domain